MCPVFIKTSPSCTCFLWPSSPYPFDKFLLTYEDLALELLPVSGHPWPIFIETIIHYHSCFSTRKWFCCTSPQGVLGFVWSSILSSQLVGMGVRFLTSSKGRPGMLLNTIQCTELPPTTEKSLSWNVNNLKGQKQPLYFNCLFCLTVLLNSDLPVTRTLFLPF